MQTITYLPTDADFANPERDLCTIYDPFFPDNSNTAFTAEELLEWGEENASTLVSKRYASITPARATCRRLPRRSRDRLRDDARGRLQDDPAIHLCLERRPERPRRAARLDAAPYNNSRRSSPNMPRCSTTWRAGSSAAGARCTLHRGARDPRHSHPRRQRRADRARPPRSRPGRAHGDAALSPADRGHRRRSRRPETPTRIHRGAHGFLQRRLPLRRDGFRHVRRRGRRNVPSQERFIEQATQYVITSGEPAGSDEHVLRVRAPIRSHDWTRRTSSRSAPCSTDAVVDGVYADWVDRGFYDDISRGLGYRFELKTATIERRRRPAARWTSHSTSRTWASRGPITNARWRWCCGPETGPSTGWEPASMPAHGPRTRSVTVDLSLDLPGDMEAGAYRIFWNLPDASEELANDPRYSIRLANEGVWEAETGYNALGAEVRVERPRAGAMAAGPAVRCQRTAQGDRPAPRHQRAHARNPGEHRPYRRAPLRRHGRSTSPTAG